jgi:predicted metal-dependent peptidase
MLPATASIEKVCVQMLLREPFWAQLLMGIPKVFDPAVSTAATLPLQRQMIAIAVNPAYWAGLSEERRYGLLKREALHIASRHVTGFKNYPNRQLFAIAAELTVNQYLEPAQLPDDALTLDFFTPFGFSPEPEKDAAYYCEQLTSSGREGRNLFAGKAIPERHWQAWAALSSSELRLVEQFINNAVRQALARLKPQDRVALPGSLLAALPATGAEPATTDWRRALRLFAASSSSTFLKSTIRRPSKRYGTVPGIRLHRRRELAIAIDTSGSISAGDMARFFREIHQIWRQGARISIVECDTAIRRSYPYMGAAPPTTSGRGSTRFDAPLEWANERRPDALLYFTDGKAPAPQQPARMPLLWVIASNGASDLRHLPGKHIQLTAD